MRSVRKVRLFCFFLTVLIAVQAAGKTEVQAKGNVKVSAESAIVMDVQSGSILYSKNMDKKQYPASITKIMTALLAIENSSLSETVTFSKTAVLNLESGASNIGIQVGEKLSMEDSLYAILLMSANEVCNGVAEHIAGSIKNYVSMMNRRAKELGCTGTHFANVNGLWMKNHYTTAHDMALIARAAYNNATFAKITGTKRYKIGKTNKNKAGHDLYNHHGMLYGLNFPQYVYEYCVGGKTGYTSKCRYTLVTYAKKKDTTLVSVVMRVPNSPWTEPNEYTDSIKLLNYSFDNFTRYSILDNSEEAVISQNLFTQFSSYYDRNTSRLSIDEDAGVILPKGVSMDKTQKNVEYYDTPQTLADGKQVIGKISYTYNNSVVGGSNIYYSDNREGHLLNDSMDMSKWYDDALEKANEAPFPWKTVLIVLVAVILAGALTFLLVYQLVRHREHRRRKNHYKQGRRHMRDRERELYFGKKR